MPERPGGFVQLYTVPLEELPELASLLRRGRDWARTNGITLSPRLAARAADIDGTAAVLVRKAIAASGNPHLGVQDIAASGNAQNGHFDKLYTVGFLSTTAVSGLTGLGVRRVRQLASEGSLPARRTTAGWVFDPKGVEVFMMNRDNR